MTCFSIHKILVLGLILAVGISAPLSAFAQTQAKPSKKDDREPVIVDAPIVLELFTASDCSACIFADRMLYDAMKDKNVIALSCHIKELNSNKTGDTQSGPIDPCALRQWTYSGSRREESVDIGIPSFIFNGEMKMGVESIENFETTLENYHYQHVNKAMDVFTKWKDEDTISINLPINEEREKYKRGASVWIIRYKDVGVEKIDSGPNAGKVLRFSNIVQDVKHVGKWHGSARTIEVDVPKPQGGKERGGYAVMVQEMMGKPILAAGNLADYRTPADERPTDEPAVLPAP